MELEESRAALEKNGLRLVGISYDSVAILSAFTARRKIGFPLLADVGSVFGVMVVAASASGVFCSHI